MPHGTGQFVPKPFHVQREFCPVGQRLWRFHVAGQMLSGAMCHQVDGVIPPPAVIQSIKASSKLLQFRRAVRVACPVGQAREIFDSRGNPTVEAMILPAMCVLRAV